MDSSYVYLSTANLLDTMNVICYRYHTQTVLRRRNATFFRWPKFHKYFCIVVYLHPSYDSDLLSSYVRQCSYFQIEILYIENYNAYKVIQPGFHLFSLTTNYVYLTFNITIIYNKCCNIRYPWGPFRYYIIIIIRMKRNYSVICLKG